MALPAWSIIRKVLGKLTDILTLGRAAGLWDKKNDFKLDPPNSGNFKNK
jgi:hypothetical protein